MPCTGKGGRENICSDPNVNSFWFLCYFLSSIFFFHRFFLKAKCSYVCQVLEPNWHIMHSRLQTAKSIDEVWSSFTNMFISHSQRKIL